MLCVWEGEGRGREEVKMFVLAPKQKKRRYVSFIPSSDADAQSSVLGCLRSMLLATPLLGCLLRSVRVEATLFLLVVVLAFFFGNPPRDVLVVVVDDDIWGAPLKYEFFFIVHCNLLWALHFECWFPL